MASTALDNAWSALDNVKKQCQDVVDKTLLSAKEHEVDILKAICIVLGILCAALMLVIAVNHRRAVFKASTTNVAKPQPKHRRR